MHKVYKLNIQAIYQSYLFAGILLALIFIKLQSPCKINVTTAEKSINPHIFVSFNIARNVSCKLRLRICEINLHIY